MLTPLNFENEAHFTFEYSIFTYVTLVFGI